MADDQKNTPNNNSFSEDLEYSEDVWRDNSADETNKLQKVTEEMLQNFADSSNKKNDDVGEENTQEEENQEDITKEDGNDEENLEENITDDKTVVEFIEDEAKPVSVSKEKKKKNIKPIFTLKFFVWVFVVLLILLCIFGIWNRWFRYDDQSQIVSSWQINGGQNTVIIDEKNIVLSKDAILEYTIDSGAKLIYYQIGDKKGVSHYRFSWDRNQLALIESTNMDGISTLLSDLGWCWDYITCKMSKIDLSPAYTKLNKQEVDTENTGLDDIMINGQRSSILLDRITQKKTDAQ